MLLYSPIVTTASLCTALRISNETCTRDELIETYLAKMRAGRGAEGAACGASNQRPAPKKAVVGGGRAGAAGGKGAGPWRKRFGNFGDFDDFDDFDDLTLYSPAAAAGGALKP